MTEKYTRFITLLKSMFELDKSDLDFGIYRIINIRREQIIDFLEKKLQAQVLSVLSAAAVDDNTVKARLAEIEKTCADVGVAPQDSPKFKDEYAGLKAQLSSGTNITELETDVYSALYNFFNRYYDEGDFISKRRYKEGVYAIPYEGEEVKLYWANHDQYYIKSSENFKDYSFTADGKTVHFKLVDATTETANNKENGDNKRVFMLLEQDFIEETENELIIKFVYDIPADKKIKYAEQNLERLNAAIISDYKDWAAALLRTADQNAKKPVTILEKHLNAYVAKNSFDYFIHKDLQGFLSRELDFFIKSEVMHLDDIDTDNEQRVSAYLAKVKAIKRVGKIIIAFLAQIENFQKKLWLKKKFVVETNWCITLDRIDEKFYAEIAANEAQIKEWCEMYAIDEIEGNLMSPGFALPLSAEFLKANQNLVLDTKHFSPEFKDKLIASIDNLEEQTNGLLIHSENFQALNLLQEKYREQIDGIYIDPPYNADATRILYKNGFLHSSWCAFLHDRINLSKAVLRNEAILCATIDDYELYNLKSILDISFSDGYMATIVIRNNPSGRSTVSGFSVNHEYAMFYAKQIGKSAIGRLSHSDEQISRYSETDSTGRRFEWENFRKSSAGSFKNDRPKQYYPIIIKRAELSARLPLLIWDEQIREWRFDGECAVDEEIVYPLDSNGTKRVWRYGIERINSIIANVKIVHKDNRYELYTPKYLQESGTLPRTWWDKTEYSARDNGTRMMANLFGGGKPFDFPKAVVAVEDSIKVLTLDDDALILDYFAGSGTTAHAVINLNRSDNGNRKYILVEMGEYFNTVTKPRVKKVIYSADWKNGKPQNRDSGVSQIMKYIRLESYEDTLQNIELDDGKHSAFSLFGDEYLLHYMLNTESEGSLLNLDLFKAPFSYKLNITEKNESTPKNIDLCETFNYLIGLNVARQSEIKRYSTAPDADGAYEGAVKLRPDDGGNYAFKMIEGKLRTGEKTLVIWRTMTDDLIADNAALDAYFAQNFLNPADREFDLIFVNGDNNIENLRIDGETWKINLIEIEMKKRMFENI